MELHFRGTQHTSHGTDGGRFLQSFQFGTGNTSIGLQDLAGVSLAAIKALDQRTLELQKKTAEVDQLRARVSELQFANNVMEKRLSALEQNSAKQMRHHKVETEH